MKRMAVFPDRNRTEVKLSKTLVYRYRSELTQAAARVGVGHNSKPNQTGPNCASTCQSLLLPQRAEYVSRAKFVQNSIGTNMSCTYFNDSFSVSSAGSNI